MKTRKSPGKIAQLLIIPKQKADKVKQKDSGTLTDDTDISYSIAEKLFSMSEVSLLWHGNFIHLNFCKILKNVKRVLIFFFFTVVLKPPKTICPGR